MTSAGDMMCKYIIHGVKPPYHILKPSLSYEFQQDYILKILEFANDQKDIKSLAITPINFSAIGYPKGKNAALTL
jgi:O-acetyl-ADP-ribose deacetylase (regulator of RNase III)